jgi:hypothetical protein
MGKVTHVCTGMMLIHFQKMYSTEARFKQDQEVFYQVIEMRTTSTVCALLVKRQAVFFGEARSMRE